MVCHRKPGGALATSSACGPFDANSGDADSGPTGAAAGDGGAAQFYALAKEKCAQNLGILDAQSSTPEQQHQVLLNIDALAAAAPEEIHANFARFDEFEHKLLGAGGNPTGELAQEAGRQQLRDPLARVAAYLDKHCGIPTRDRGCAQELRRVHIDDRWPVTQASDGAASCH